MLMNYINHLDNLQTFVIVFNNCPTLVFTNVVRVSNFKILKSKIQGQIVMT